jgi:membrane protease YdiL (CAAX protease family)
MKGRGPWTSESPPLVLTNLRCQVESASPRPILFSLTVAVSVLCILGLTLQGVSGLILLAIVTVLSMLLIRSLPPRFPPIDVLAQRSQVQIRQEARPLLLYALLFPLLTIPFVLWGRAGMTAVLPAYPAAGWVFSWNFLLCKVLLLLLPTVVFAVRLHSTGVALGLRGVTGLWRWLGPLLSASPIVLIGAVLPLALFLTQKGSIVPLWVVGIVGVFVLLAGAIPEEYFYRALLQTHLERLYGRWNGIALSAVLFGLFHLPLHYATLQIALGPQAGVQFLLSTSR